MCLIFFTRHLFAIVRLFAAQHIKCKDANRFDFDDRMAHQRCAVLLLLSLALLFFYSQNEGQSLATAPIVQRTHIHDL